jgi:hypothetical protein
MCGCHGVCSQLYTENYPCTSVTSAIRALSCTPCDGPCVNCVVSVQKRGVEVLGNIVFRK